jgi:hypothetical protein
MNRNLFVAVLATVALALGLNAGAASAAGDGKSATAEASKTKKKGKAKKKSCKGKKGKAKKKCKKGGKGKRGSKGSSGSLSNGRYTDEQGGVVFVVSGGGRIQLETLELPTLCIFIEAHGEGAVPLKSRKGSLVAEQTFQVSGRSVLTVSWSVEIDPDSLRYSLEYTASYEIPSSDPEVRPVRCDDRGRFGGKLTR